MFKALILFLALSVVSLAQHDGPRITSFSPASGPEGTRIEIQGSNLATTRAVRFHSASALFRINSDDSISALVPMHALSGPVTVVTDTGRIESATTYYVVNDPRIPFEVRYKTGYVNIIPRPPGFRVALLWGIAIADTHAAGYDKAKVEIAWTKLSCRIDGHDVLLNHDTGKIRGGLYLRDPWFGGSNAHEIMPLAPTVGLAAHQPVILPVGRGSDRIWHFWSASGRANVPSGDLRGCTAQAQVRISPGALLQLGMDYWRDQHSLWAPHAQNNHEAGVSRWYFASPDWQDVVFTDLP